VTKVLIPTCMHLLVSGRLVVVFVIVSMTPRSAASVSFLDSLFLLGCSWVSGKACACCLEERSRCSEVARDEIEMLRGGPR
jgi:hypothetical protein